MLAKFLRIWIYCIDEGGARARRRRKLDDEQRQSYNRWKLARLARLNNELLINNSFEKHFKLNWRWFLLLFLLLLVFLFGGKIWIAHNTGFESKTETGRIETRLKCSLLWKPWTKKPLKCVSSIKWIIDGENCDWELTLFWRERVLFGLLSYIWIPLNVVCKIQFRYQTFVG